MGVFSQGRGSFTEEGYNWTQNNRLNSKACRFLVHKSDNPEIHVNTIIESDNAEFFENIYPYKNETESTSERPKRPQEESMENILTSEEPRRSTRQRKFVSFGPNFVAL